MILINPLRPKITANLINPRKSHVAAQKIEPFATIPPPILQMFPKMEPFFVSPTINYLNSVNFHVSSQKAAPLSESDPKFAPLLKFQAIWPPNCANLQCLFKNVAFFAVFSSPAPAFADEVPQKINVEQILVSIDDFFNRNPFFVAGVTFIWLVVIPLTQEYLKKCKAISAIDAFRKLNDVPAAQLLDIRKMKSVRYMNSPNLKILNKSVVQIEFNEDDEEGFVEAVLKKFEDPGNAIICVLDNFDGDSLKVAELLYKKGFKEAYAIKGGLRGKDGWQAIQENFFPPSMHVYPRKKKRKSPKQSKPNDENDEMGGGNGQAVTLPDIDQDKSLNSENGYVKATESTLKTTVSAEKPLSPYPNYPDLKPPSSPSPSQPRL